MQGYYRQRLGLPLNEVHGVAVAVGVTVGVTVLVGVLLGDGPVPVAVHAGNLKEEIQVLQLKPPLVLRYSVVYQKVQSSAGSMRIDV